MTAEVALMNKRAVALAADSAVTYRGKGGDKIFESANKIFSLSKYEPVGVMVYGAAQIMETPWETIIKLYRDQLGETRFPHVEDYAEDFLAYLNNHEVLCDKPLQDRLASRIVRYNYSRIASECQARAEQTLEETDHLTHGDLKKITKSVIERHYRKWQNTTDLRSVPDNYADRVITEYGDLIAKEKSSHFDGLLTAASSRWIRRIGELLLTRFDPTKDSLDYAGVVFAGYGSNETFPALRSYRIRGVIADQLQQIIDHSNTVGPEADAAVARPFAQEDVVNTFMEGIHPDVRDAVLYSVSEIAAELPGRIIDEIDELSDQEKESRKEEFKNLGLELARSLLRNLRHYRRTQHAEPILETISILPKDELAQAAQSLVQLTSFKRRVSVDQDETVKGPIDVVVISKGDGLIWIDRKHYFEPELNHHFFENYFRTAQSSRNRVDETEGK